MDNSMWVIILLFRWVIGMILLLNIREISKFKVVIG